LAPDAQSLLLAAYGVLRKLSRKGVVGARGERLLAKMAPYVDNIERRHRIAERAVRGL